MSDIEKPSDPVTTPPAPVTPVAEDKPDRIHLLRDKAAAAPGETRADTQTAVASARDELRLRQEESTPSTTRWSANFRKRWAARRWSGTRRTPPTRQAQRSRRPEGPKKGKVFRIHGQDVFIDLPGGRSQGVMQIMNFPEPPKIGDEVEVHIDGFDQRQRSAAAVAQGRRGGCELGERRGGPDRRGARDRVEQGGLAVVVNNIRGFMPISQIELFRVENIETYVNQKLLCMVTEVDPVERNLVVSRRALLDKEREENREKLWTTLAEGQIFQGVVRQVKEFALSWTSAAWTVCCMSAR